jgi:AcrR family transcriptional regulator
MPEGKTAVRPRRPAAAPSPLREKKRQAVRREIAHAAWLLFAGRGYEATTVDEIARRSGISRRTFFRYFSSKEDVAVGTSDALAEDFLAAFAGRPGREPPLASIRHAIRLAVLPRLADAAEAQAIIRLLRESPTLRRAMLERHARMEERLAALVARRAGANPRKDPTPALLAFVARALVDTAFNVWYDQRPKDPGAMVDSLFERLRDVIVPRSGRGGRRRRAS